MENEIFLWLAGIVITVLITYHVAWRQGAFRKASPQVLLGLPTEDGEDVWVVIIPVMELPVTHFVTFIPIQIINPSDESLRNVEVQITTHRDLTVLQLRGAAPDLYDELRHYPDAKSQYILGDRAVVDHTVEAVSPGAGTVLGHAVVCPSSALRGDPGIWVSRLTWQLTAANARKLTGAGYVVFVRSATGYEDQEEGSRVAKALLDQARLDGALRPWTVWRWRSPNKPLESRTAMVIRVNWLHVEPGVGLDGSMFSREMSDYRLDTIDVIVLPGVLNGWRRPGV